jgi:hypothetical protein
MALGGATLAEMARLKEVAAAREVLEAMPETLLETTSYNQAEASKVLDRDAKTLKTARGKRKDAGKKLDSISPLALASIHFHEVDGVATYPAIELLNYLKRVKFARKLSIAVQDDPSKYEESIRPTTMLAFQTWLASAPATEKWPFCIQSSGRPVDLVAALVLGLTTADVRWLTVREFSNRAADSSRLAYAQDEAIVIGSNTCVPKDAQDESEGEKRKRRWTNSGGPM